MSFLSSPHSDDFSLMSSEDYPLHDEMSKGTWETPQPSARSISPSGTDRTVTPTQPTLPIPEPVTPSEPISPVLEPTPPFPEPVTPVSLSNLVDLLEGLRDRAEGLWEGQRSTNHMLDELRERRPPVYDDSALREKLQRIEDVLESILRNFAPRQPDQESSDTSSVSHSTDTSSALHNTLRRLTDIRRPPKIPHIIHAPTPVRPAPPSLDAKWNGFLNGPAPQVDQPIQGPPPLVPLIRRSPRISRMSSFSPPLPSIITSRPQSVPPMSTVHFDVPPIHPRRRRQPWPFPPLGQPFRSPTTDSASDRFDFPRVPRQGQVGVFPDAPRRRPVEEGPDFDREVRMRRPGDGFIDATRRMTIVILRSD
jgi:hypothetical protein